MSQRDRRFRWGVAALVGALYLVGAGVLLLWPNGAQIRRLILDVYLFGLYRLGVPVVVGPEYYEAAGNVLLFVPLGVGAALVLGRRWWLAPVLGMILSMAVEKAQSGSGMVRVSEWIDVLWNTTGCLIGALVGALLLRWTAKRSLRAT